MFVEFISHVLNLDIAWLIGLAMGNLFMVFALFAAIYIVLDGKNAVYGFMVLCLMLFAAVDFENASGLVLLGAEYLAFNYITKVGLLAFVALSPTLSRRIPLFEEMHFISSLIIFNFFMR